MEWRDRRWVAPKLLSALLPVVDAVLLAAVALFGGKGLGLPFTYRFFVFRLLSARGGCSLSKSWDCPFRRRRRRGLQSVEIS